ncbi:MAG: DUF3365 domain-containing protein [Myxococcales bacterium]|nr:DUF3365 domain-containing protein [Myxococcales bacterium]
MVVLGGLAGDAGREREAGAFGARAQAAVGPLKKELMGALQGAMGQGVEAALAVCNVEAPGIAARVSAAAGLDVGRVSHKPRNPGNALAAWMAPAMAHFEGSTAAAPAAPVVMAAPTGGLVYFEPIYTGGLCLSCHGEAIAPGVQAKLAVLYPDDRATGFRAGELRGLFRVSSAVE